MYSLDINKKRVGFCRNYARKILTKYGCSYPPINLFQIAEKEGFVVKLLDQPDGFSGILHRETKAIGINQNHHIHRQRFSLAHEMGHYYLGHPEVQQLHYLEDSEQKQKVFDQEADEFAGEILVPRKMLKQEIKQHKNIEYLAQKFRVSSATITIQITKHGLLGQLVNK